MEPTTRFSIPEEVVGRSLGEDLLVHCFDTDDVFVLNADARRVFEAFKETASRDDVLRLLDQEGFDPEEAASVLDESIAEMLQLGILEVSEGESS